MNCYTYLFLVKQYTFSITLILTPKAPVPLGGDGGRWPIGEVIVKFGEFCLSVLRRVVVILAQSGIIGDAYAVFEYFKNCISGPDDRGVLRDILLHRGGIGGYCERSGPIS
jgi:hypothetical protein